MDKIFIYNILIGITTSVIGSFIFLIFILIFLRPRIKISNNIACYFENDIKIYRFKIMNTSLYTGYDVSLSLRSLREIPSEPFGKDIFPSELILGTSNFTNIHPWRPSFMCKNYAHHCIQVKTIEDIENILNSDNYSLQLQVTLRHGLTGLSKSFIANYSTVKRILDGQFEFGNSFEII
jgi:hypothetical protein